VHINEFWARYEGHLHFISWSMASIPPILQVVFSCGYSILVKKQSLNSLCQKRRKYVLPQSTLLFPMKNKWMSLPSLPLMANLVSSRIIHWTMHILLRSLRLN